MVGRVGATVGMWCASLAGASYTGDRVEPESIRWVGRSDAGEFSLVGDLRVPDGDGPFPLAIVINGSGCSRRGDRSNIGTATSLAERGVATVVYDKRGCGDSGGDWREVGLEPLAEDVAELVRVVSLDRRIDADGIGLIGHSQGAWIALLAAEALGGEGPAGEQVEAEPRIAWIVWASGAPTTPAEQNNAMVALHVRAAGHGDEAVEAATALERRIGDVYRHDAGWDEARALVDAASGEAWFDQRLIGLQPRDFWNWRWYARLMDHDPRAALASLDVPILAVWGSEDLLVPAEASREEFERVSGEAPARRDVAVFEGLDHRLSPGPRTPPPQEVWDTIAAWIAGLEARGG